MNLTAQQNQIADWFSDGGSKSLDTVVCDPGCGASYRFWPITYYTYKASGSVTSRASYDLIQITSTTAASATFWYKIKNADGTITTATRTRDQEIQNFANWFQYYRSRISAARAGIGRAFSTLGDTPRVGFATFNTPAQYIDGVSSHGTVLKGVRPFTSSDRTELLQHALRPHDRRRRDAFARSDGRRRSVLHAHRQQRSVGCDTGLLEQHRAVELSSQLSPADDRRLLERQCGKYLRGQGRMSTIQRVRRRRARKIRSRGSRPRIRTVLSIHGATAGATRSQTSRCTTGRGTSAAIFRTTSSRAPATMRSGNTYPCMALRWACSGRFRRPRSRTRITRLIRRSPGPIRPPAIPRK